MVKVLKKVDLFLVGEEWMRVFFDIPSHLAL
jgi:hypothetical protein